MRERISQREAEKGGGGKGRIKGYQEITGKGGEEGKKT